MSKWYEIGLDVEETLDANTIFLLNPNQILHKQIMRRKPKTQTNTAEIAHDAWMTGRASGKCLAYSTESAPDKNDWVFPAAIATVLWSMEERGFRRPLISSIKPGMANQIRPDHKI